MSMTSQETLAEIDQLRRRLEVLGAAVARQALAEVAPSGAADALVCRVGQERYALPLETVDRAEMMCALVPFPEAPIWVPGLLNLHGDLIPVLDAQARLSRRRRDVDPEDFILVCRSGSSWIGVVVQEVLGVCRVDSERMRPVPRELPQAPYVVGLVEGEGPPVFLLSLACFISMSDVPEGG